MLWVVLYCAGVVFGSELARHRLGAELYGSEPSIMWLEKARSLAIYSWKSSERNIIWLEGSELKVPVLCLGNLHISIARVILRGFAIYLISRKLIFMYYWGPEVGDFSKYREHKKTRASMLL